jgi:hypothetical protein
MNAKGITLFGRLPEKRHVILDRFGFDLDGLILTGIQALAIKVFWGL